MHPLRIAFLWHFHQPDYRSQSGFTLPWVRLHAAKDYSWLPSLIASYPTVKQTFNVVPTLLDQLAAYTRGTTDALQQEAHRLVDGYSPENPDLLAKALTVLNATRMITHPRHDKLHRDALSGTWQEWTHMEWVELMTWYHLAWCSPQMRSDDLVVKGLLAKGQDFTTADLHALMQSFVKACDDVVPTLRRLYTARSTDIAVTPYHHPILPLLCNTEVTHEALPTAELPPHPFEYPDDASTQIANAIASAKDTFGIDIQGMWPAEGSISNEALQLFSKHDVRWVASDEGVLENSLGSAYTATSKYRVWSVGPSDETVAVFFRDRALSDAIGFVYSSWEAERAADDFVRMLEERRRLIIHTDGEDGLLDSVVSIILDGENCWEFFEENGDRFLHALFSRLADTTQYTCVGMNEAARPTHALPSLKAGSWIGASFDVWIGSPLKNLAWSLLREARTALAGANSALTGDNTARAGDRNTSGSVVWDAMYSAESSDWFWWYDDRHQAPNKHDFDTLFRERLMTVFNACKVQPSLDLSRSLYEHIAPANTTQQGAIHISYGSVAMHSGNQLVHSLSLEVSGLWHRISIHLERKPNAQESITITLRSEGQKERSGKFTREMVSWSSDVAEESAHWHDERTIAIHVRAQSVWSIGVDEESTDGQHQSTWVELRPL